MERIYFDLQLNVSEMSNCRRAVLFLMLVSLSSLVAASECGSDGRVVLPIGLFSSSDVLRTSSAIPAAELAIQQINENRRYLPGYCLKGVVYDSIVSSKLSSCIRLYINYCCKCLPMIGVQTL